MLRLAEADSNSRLTAPRRYGKTTLLKRVREEAEGFGMNTVYVNFYGLLYQSGETADHHRGRLSQEPAWRGGAQFRRWSHPHL